MIDAGRRPPQFLVAILLGAVVALAVAVRVPSLQVPGHTGDVYVISTWAERMAAVGPLGYYAGSGSIYPALLYLYWPLGVLFDGPALDLAIKALAIPFDVAVGLLLFAIVRSRAGGLAGTGAAALYLLNPAVVLAGPVWGQIDAAGTLVLVASLVATAARRWVLAGALAMVAGLVKPQFGLVMLPVLVLGVMAWRAGHGRAPLLRSVVGAVAGYLLVAGPLLLNPIQHIGNVIGVTGIRPEASVLAPNPWALLVGYGAPDTGYTWVGGVLLLAGLAAAMLPLRRSADLRSMLMVGTFIVFAFYFLPTRVHERYLFPAMAVLAPLAAVSQPVLVGYLAMEAGFALSLLYALVDTTPFTMSPAWTNALLRREMVVGLSVLLIAAALVLVVLLVRGAGARLSDRQGERLEGPVTRPGDAPAAT